MMKKKTIEEKIKEIVAYHSDDGTSGWLLDDKQIKKLVNLFSSTLREVVGEDEECDHFFQDIKKDNLLLREDGARKYGRNMLRQEQRQRAKKLGIKI